MSRTIKVSELIKILERMPKGLPVYKMEETFGCSTCVMVNKVSHVVEHTPGFTPDEYVLLDFDHEIPTPEQKAEE